jgi:CRP-like cAMP-binding protein
MTESGTRRSFPAGTVLFREGDPGREMFVIVTGRVRISKRVRDVEKAMTTLPSGEFFGEMAILSDRPRSATATVLEDAELLVVGPETFDGLVGHHREVALRLIRGLAMRLEEANEDLMLLLHNDPSSRVAHALKRFACSVGQRRNGHVRIELGPGELGERLGLPTEQVEAVLARFHEKGIVLDRSGEYIELGEPTRLDRLLEFLELRHQFSDLV